MNSGLHILMFPILSILFIIVFLNKNIHPLLHWKITGKMQDLRKKKKSTELNRLPIVWKKKGKFYNILHKNIQDKEIS